VLFGYTGLALAMIVTSAAAGDPRVDLPWIVAGVVGLLARVGLPPSVRALAQGPMNHVFEGMRAVVTTGGCCVAACGRDGGKPRLSGARRRSSRAPSAAR
jgi:hypothetical protein